MAAVPPDLRRVLGPPGAEPVDWPGVERELGFLPPSDYRSYAESYPALDLGGELSIWHPTCSVAEANLVRGGKEWTAVHHELWAEDPQEHPYPVYPEPGGLFAWGTTTDGHTLFWRTKDWQVVVEQQGEHWVFDGTFTGFVLRQLDGTLQCPLFGPLIERARTPILVR